MTPAVWAAVIAAGYLLGALPTGLLLGLALRGVDIRRHGSGNVGATNALRVLGRGPSAVVFVADLGKALAAVLLARLLGAPPGVESLAGVAAVVGHCWSAYIAFRGGRGVAASLGALLAVSPPAALLGLAAAVAVIARTRYVSLGSLVGTALGALALLGLVAMGLLPPGYALLAPAAVVVFVRHRENVQRLRSGTERRLGQGAVATAAVAAGQAAPDEVV